MKNVKYLVGSENICTDGIRAFSDDICEFVGMLSNALLKDRTAASFPDIVSFAYFCRKANITRIKRRYESEFRFGRGLALSIAPSNVPINFAFSFLFGLITGNANIVRVSSKNFPQTDIVCRAIRETIKAYPELEKRNAVISYEADDETSACFSAMADVRIIWGGDATVTRFKSYPTKPRCVDIAFSDRYSVGVIDASAVSKADDKELAALANAFYNDTYLTDQNACSSPRIIFWLNANDEAKERFWSAAAMAAKNKYVLEDEKAVNKYIKLCSDIIESDKKLSYKKDTNILYRVRLDELPEDITKLSSNCGYFYEYDINSLADINSYIVSKFQTMCYYGIDKQDITGWALTGLRGIDRIVPFGHSMDIMEIWDGYDIVRSASRILSID